MDEIQDEEEGHVAKVMVIFHGLSVPLSRLLASKMPPVRDEP